MFFNKKIQNRMLKRLLFCVFIVLPFSTLAQSVRNIVSNYSFEDTIQCPFNGGQVNFCKSWFNPVPSTSPDYFNVCSNSKNLTIPSSTSISVPNNRFGNQMPRTGNAYCGFGVYATSPVDYRENIKNRLKQTLTINKSYCVTYYINLAENSRFITTNISTYFSNDSIISSFSLINATPILQPSTMISDTINWSIVQGTYTAIGSENFITFGNFINDAGTPKTQVKPLTNLLFNDYSYYYIDDVSVVEINPATAAIKDSLISRCFMDSVLLGTDSTEFATYTWQSTAAGLAALSCTTYPNPIAKPLITTKYYLTKQQCSATTMDSVMVVVLKPTTQPNGGNDKTICLGDVVQIGTQDSLAFTNYNWQNAATLSCTNCAMPFTNPNITTTYTVQRTECANVTTDTVKIIIDDCDPTFVLPNVFTPNYDDVNDTWGISFSTVNSHITNFKMNIYDRWGLLVYETNPDLSLPKAKWDGHTTSGMECSSGVYYYIITFEKNEEHILLKGHLSLFR